MLPGYDPHKGAGDCVFDAKRARHYVNFFRDMLTHTKGKLAGQPIILEAWQKAIIGNLFGWYRPDGTRRYRTFFFYVPRKNGKTTIAAGIALVLLYLDDELGKEIYAAAAEREQANILFAIAKGMVQQEPELEKRCTVFRNVITREDEGSFFKSISAEAGTKHGYNASGILIDELHAQKNRDLVDVLETSIGSRSEPLIGYLSTADFDRPEEDSICNEKLHYARDVRDGVIDDPEFLPAIYEALPEDDWHDRKTWKKANPNLGVSLSMRYFEAQYKRACEQPSFENTFKRLHLNLQTQQDIRWLPLERWDACDAEVDPDALIGRVCFGGLDLSSTTDITALVLVFPTDAGGYEVLAEFWVAEEVAFTREKNSRARYETWGRQGHIHLCKGDAIDHREVRDRIMELRELYQIVEIGVDRWQAAQISTELGMAGLQLTKVGQGFQSLSGPMKALEMCVLRKEIAHGGNPVMRWMFGNISAETDAAGNVKPSKKTSTEKIDGIVAMIMAIGVAEVSVMASREFSENGLVVL